MANLKIQSATTAIEELLVGSGADMFREFEQRMSGFCPFEAVGMVRQEIRHSHFLSFILDPNRPHPFQDHFLRQFVQEVISQATAGQLTIDALKTHCSDLSGAIVMRERENIDILIEVPPGAIPGDSKGLIMAVEVKVDASESAHQLGKYRQHIEQKYSNDWHRIFVFLTKNAEDPQGKNIEHWIPIGLKDIVNRFDNEFDFREFSGPAAELYSNYSKMIRRHLVTDESMQNLANNIWSKHKEALEALYELRPNLQADILNAVSNRHEEVNVYVEGFRLSIDTSTPKILRFSVDNWLQKAGFSNEDSSWVASGSLILIEVYAYYSDRVRCGVVMGPGDDEVRHRLYKKILDHDKIKISRKTKEIKTWKHLSTRDVMTSENYKSIEKEDKTIDDVATKVIKNLANFLNEILPLYDELIELEFGVSG